MWQRYFAKAYAENKAYCSTTESMTAVLCAERMVKVPDPLSQL